MIEHYVVQIGSEMWWQGLIFSTAFISLPVWLGRRLPIEQRNHLAVFIGILLLAATLSIHPYMITKGTWTAASSLPLQLCSMSALLSGLIYFYRSQLLYELLVFWGLGGAFHSLLTPEMSLGNDSYLKFEYYLAHAGIILSALYCTAVLGFRPRKNSWLRVFGLTQIVMLAVGVLNLVLDANYMYLCKKPVVDNPLIMGEWPWYLVILELAGMLHFFVIYQVFKWTGTLQEDVSPQTP